MAKEGNQKLKIVYLMKILLERTDETHSMTMPEILEALRGYGVTAERKSIYNDIENLRQYGLDIIGEKQEKNFCYYIGQRQFELAELKVLVDSVQSAKFITAKKSRELIKKIEALASKYDAQKLQRQVYVGERIKAANESIYYNVDDIHTAIGLDAQITFQYFMWDVNKKMVLRRGGEYYQVSPWALCCDDDNYYLVAYDSEEKKIKHFRVDKMLHISIVEKHREGKEHFKQFDMGRYARKMFGMFSGEEKVVTLECSNDKAGIIIDRFGKDIPMIRIDEEHFRTKIKVAVSRQFFAWVISLGSGVKIVDPEDVVEEIRVEIRRLHEQYLGYTSPIH